MALNDNLGSMSHSLLYVVATPIGNLQDISPRAASVLAEADLVVAEDTRHTRKLLQHLGIETRLQAMHEHNEADMLPGLLQRLADGETLAVVSDAGTPLISDPGFRLVRAAAQAGVEIRAVPGPSAVTAALSISGMATDRFAFEGFLPARAAARRQALEGWRAEPRTLVFFESSHRIEACLQDLLQVLGGERRVALCRELTKRFETVLRGSLAEVLDQVRADPNQRKGEFVLVLESAPAVDPGLGQALDLARELARELPASKAARIAARISGVSRREIYAALGEPD
jgi:16S rRNA (cytidine1402-2'-O)-methyltransferase